MDGFVSWEQLAVLLESFSPTIIYRLEEVSDELAVSIFNNIKSNDMSKLKGNIKLLINLHRVAYAICQAHDLSSSKIVASHRYWRHFFSIGSEIDKHLLPKDYDLLKCPYEELNCLLKAAFLLADGSEDMGTLQEKSKKKKDELDSLRKVSLLTPTLSP